MKHIFASSIRNYLAGGILFGFLAGCSVLDPAEEIPSYLHIDAMQLSATGSQGTSISNITDAWVFMDGELLGAFELPCTLPILAEGTHSFIVRAGVKMNGLASTRAIYPFMKGWEGNITLTRAEVTSLNTLTVNYFSGISYVWMEDFDDAGFSIATETGSATSMVRTSANGIEGQYGLVQLSSDTFNYIGSGPANDLAPPTSDTYIEFDYRCNQPFTVGVLSNSTAGQYSPWVSVEPSEEWNKIYIRLTDVLGSVNPTPDYKIYFGMIKESDVAQPYLNIDNIKLLK